MIRSLRFSLGKGNASKLKKLEMFHEMYMEDLKFYIDLLKTEKLPIQNFLSSKLLPKSELLFINKQLELLELI